MVATMLAVLVAAARLAAEDKGKLEPFSWKKPAPQAEGEADRPGARRLKPMKAPQESDELVCEKDVVHPTTQPGLMGVRHCWKKSDPHTIIERPFTLGDPVIEGTAEAVQSGYKPLKKPRIPKKTAPKAPAPEASANP